MRRTVFEMMGVRRRSLLEWDEQSDLENYLLLAGSIFFVLMSGLMSGLTLGASLLLLLHRLPSD